ncbi:NfeD family protein [Huintestinicola sp.]|uniref:NfeD family protein n=1 Tax=Huintestinicola sp. TaxID=2981661 RepID=UPI003D7CE09E
MMYILWIIVMIAAVLVEAASFALLSIWFAVGALAALVAAILGAGTGVQIGVFLAVSVILLAATRPLLKKLMPKKYIPTNGELDLGKTAVVIEKIDGMAGTGRVRLEGVDWGAVSADGSVIETGVSVTVIAKGAAYLTVQPVQSVQKTL